MLFSISRQIKQINRAINRTSKKLTIEMFRKNSIGIEINIKEKYYIKLFKQASLVIKIT